VVPRSIPTTGHYKKKKKKTTTTNKKNISIHKKHVTRQMQNSQEIERKENNDQTKKPNNLRCITLFSSSRLKSTIETKRTSREKKKICLIHQENSQETM
jgi:hypothetical protein